jgi:hypothetical protein
MARLHAGLEEWKGNRPGSDCLLQPGLGGSPPYTVTSLTYSRHQHTGRFVPVVSASGEEFVAERSLSSSSHSGDCAAVAQNRVLCQMVDERQTESLEPGPQP